MKKVMVFGTFDILHPGHLHFFKEAKEYGDYLIVVVARDSNVKKLKQHPPCYDEKTRAENILNLKIADKVLLGCEGTDPYLRIKEEKPDVVALGYDQKFFIDELENAVEDHVVIVRLQPHHPEIYKTTIIKENNPDYQNCK